MTAKVLSVVAALIRDAIVVKQFDGRKYERAMAGRGAVEIGA
jgi:hypothetical protein